MKDLLSSLLKSPGFLRFWAVWPRKDGKLDAAKAFDQAVRMAPGGEDQIIRAVEVYAFRPDPTFQPLAGTWLRRGSWIIESDTPPPTVLIPLPKMSAVASEMAEFERRMGLNIPDEFTIEHDPRAI